MTYTGSAIDENGYSDYVKAMIDTARKKIGEYPLLQEICSNLKDATKENYNKNIFLILASNAISDPFNNFKSNKYCESELYDFEITLKELKNKLTPKKFNNLCKKLGSFNEGQHFGTKEEINCYRYLLKNNKIKSIDYERSKFETNDFHIIFLDGSEYNLEITTLTTGKFQEKIELAYTLAARNILTELTSNLYIKINMATDKLVDNREDKSEQIKEKIMHAYNELKPIIFVDYGDFNIETNFGDLSVPLYNQKEMFKWYGSFGNRLDKLATTKEGIYYLKKLTGQELRNNPIESVTIYPSKWKLVEIHSNCFLPSKSESARKSALIKRLTRKIEEKIELGQLKRVKNSIIAVHFNDFLFENYVHPEDQVGYIFYLELKKIIENIFILKQEKEIIGVLLYDQNIFDSQFIFNPNNKDPNNIEKINKLFGENCTSGSQKVELTDDERIKYINESPLNQQYVDQFIKLCQKSWNFGQAKLKMFLDFDDSNIIKKDLFFGLVELFFKEYFITPPDMKIGYSRSSGELFGKDQYESKLKYIIEKIDEKYCYGYDKTVNVNKLLNTIERNEEYYLFYNSKIFNELSNFPCLNWISRCDNNDIKGIIKTNNSKIYLWPLYSSSYNLLIPKSEFILRQSKKGFKDFDEKLYVSVELLDKIDIDNLNKDKEEKDKQTFNDKVKITVAEKFEITRHNKKSFFRIIVDEEEKNL